MNEMFKNVVLTPPRTKVAELVGLHSDPTFEKRQDPDPTFEKKNGSGKRQILPNFY